jgi:hypothetical protein
MMKTRKTSPAISAFLLLVITTLACGQSGAPQETATEPPVQVTATKTLKPTSTPRPSPTPDIAATERADELNALIEDYLGKGYISGSDGSALELDPFREEWAQIGWFQAWLYESTGPEFVFKGHFKWSTASSTPDPSGCGLMFGIQENDDYYVAFIDYVSILFFMKRGANLYTVGKTTGPGFTGLSNPAEADVVLAVSDQKAYVSVEGEVTQYTLSVDQTTAGEFGLSLLSGTNKDYGTRCEVTDMVLWKPK